MKKENGFTIIEILIVLAIAGLIMMIVFLAVPALQRSVRNRQRTSDAGKVMVAINECLANRNYLHTSCDQLPVTELPIDMAELGQITSVVNWTVAQGDTTDLNAGRQVAVLNGHQCNADSSWVEVHMLPRQFIVFYALEGATGFQYRCMDV